MLTSNPSTWNKSHLLYVDQITPCGLDLLYRTALEMREKVQNHGGDDRLKHHILATIFYEPSTRTSCSFQAAMIRLGGNFIHVDSATSSNKKGESLSDTIKCMECYSDVLVLRHFDAGSMDILLDAGIKKPVINAGNGVGEHPTQALLDFFTIKDELNLDDHCQKKSLTVVMVGDLKHGRTVHSLGKLLASSQGLGKGISISLRYCSPESLKMPETVKKHISDCDSIQQEEYTDLRDAIKGADVLYVTRIQKERFSSEEDYKKVEGSYRIDSSLLKVSPKEMVIMHPLPRVSEIHPEVDSDPRAAYFRQMENGMYVRMAILALLLGKA